MFKKAKKSHKKNLVYSSMDLDFSILDKTQYTKK